MKFLATPIEAKNLKPGDLFSMGVDQKLWNKLSSQDDIVGIKVYIRTEAPVPADQEDMEVFKITIEGENYGL